MPITLPPPYVGLTTGLPDQAVKSSGNSVPPGVEAVLEYRANYFNVRDWLDTYLVTEIDGLADADIRDSREVNPSNHGETAFSAYYGGRTITITGKIRAQTLDKLRDLQQGLKQAFSDLEREYPLLLHSKNPENSVVVYCKKSQPIAMKDAQVGPTYTREFLITLRASNPRILSAYTSFLQWNGFSSDSFGVPATVDFTNLVTNPHFELDLTDWTAAGNAGTKTLTRENNWNAAWSARCTGTTTNANDYGGATSAPFPVVGGQNYTATMALNVTTASSAGTQLKITWKDGANATISESYAAAQTGTGLKTFSIAAPAPASAVTAVLAIFAISTTVGSYDFNFDAVSLIGGTNPPAVFTGDTTNTATYGYRWTGRPHKSASERISTTGISSNWTADSSTKRISVSPSGQLQVSGSGTQTLIYNAGYTLGDQRSGIKVTTASDVTQGTYAMLVLKASDPQNYLGARFRANGVSSRLEVLKCVNGVLSTAPSGTTAFFTTTASTNYWFTNVIIDNSMVLSLYTQDPFVNPSAIPVQTFSYGLIGTEATTFGAGVLGRSGLNLNGLNYMQDARFDDWRTEPVGMSGYIIGTAKNDGSFPAQPQIQISGPITGPVITFVDDQADTVVGSVRLNGTIPAGDTWYIDIAKRTLVNQSGVNKFPALSIDSDWPELVPGNTVIQVNGTNMDSRTTIAFAWRDTWM